MQSSFFVVPPGFEPRQTVPKTVVLPLYYGTILATEIANVVQRYVNVLNKQNCF